VNLRDPEDAPESTDALTGEVIRCDACPVLCRIRNGQAGACDRYANENATLVRVDPLLVLQRGAPAVPFFEPGKRWDGKLVSGANTFITGVGATRPIRTTSRRRSSSPRSSQAWTW